MKTWKYDISILLIFFNRPAQFERVFTEVKKAKPRRLFLYQDGAREGRLDDQENVSACRTIAEDIDWECEVHRMYQKKNYGCDPSEFIAQSWAFGIVDKLIILEDDCLPSQSFFPFCQEMLERYEHDTRIHKIMGTNMIGINEKTPWSYFFTNAGSCSGWASWKRVFDLLDKDYTFFDSDYTKELILNAQYRKRFKKGMSSYFKVVKSDRESGIDHYESIWGTEAPLQSQMNIVPKYNLIKNIGLTADSTHSFGDIRYYSKPVRFFYTMKNYEIDFPLVHPPYVINDVEFRERQNDFYGSDRLIKGEIFRIESYLRRLFLGDARGLMKGVIRRIKNR